VEWVIVIVIWEEEEEAIQVALGLHFNESRKII
jgi:hypothetical protein